MIVKDFIYKKKKKYGKIVKKGDLEGSIWDHPSEDDED